MSELPLYEYECRKDGTFERIQKFSDPPLTACPTCGGPVEKLLSAPAIQFKGTGWYITDYARKGEAGGKKDGKEATSSDKGATEAAKPASAADSSASTEGKTKAAKGGSDSKT